MLFQCHIFKTPAVVIAAQTFEIDVVVNAIIVAV
jgi:hypothetical protein